MKRKRKKKRRVSKTSVHNMRKKLHSSEEQYPNEGAEWTNAMIDDLLDAVFAYDMPLRSAQTKDCVEQICGRTAKAIQDMLYKLFVWYPRKIVIEYSPGLYRKRRSGPMTARDCVMVQCATGEAGRRNCAYTAAYIAKITGRNEVNVEVALKKLAKEALKETRKRKPFFPQSTHVIHSNAELMRAEAVYALLATDKYKSKIDSSGI